MNYPDFFSLRSVLRSAVALKLFLLLPTAAFSDPNQKPGPKLPELTVRNLFTLPPGADCGDNTYTPLWSGGGKIFTIWRDSTMHPMVSEISESGQAESVYLDPKDKFGNEHKFDPNPAAAPITTMYMAQYREFHHSYSLGLDKKGYLHITGDMNGYPGENDKFQPARYRRKIILYWRSKSPYTVKDGFEFVGGDPARAIPGTKWADGAFFADNDGELYYMSRVAAVGGMHTPPEMGVGLYRYDTTTGSWSALGAEPAHTYRDAEYHPVLFWGLPASSEINRETRGAIRFDKQNRMHFATPAAQDPSVAGMNALFYACSEDGGKTWKKASGAPITALPMRAIPGPSQADAVASFNQNGILVEYFASNDLTGNPASVNIVQRMSPPSAMANSARWSGEIAFPEAGTYSLEFHAKGSDALMTVINKQKGAQDRVNAGLNDGNAEQFEAEKGMTMGYTIEWKRSKKYPGMFTPGIKWQLAGHPKEDVPFACLLPGDTRFDGHAGVTADEKGIPAIACNPSNLFSGKWRYWDKSRRSWTGELPYPGDSQQENRILLGADGMLTFESVVGIETMDFNPKVEFFRTSAFDQVPTAYLLPNIFRIHGTDEFTLRKTGVYRTLLFEGKSQLWSVAEVEVAGKK